MNNNDQTFMAQKIRSQYMERQFTELDALRELDAKVKRPANVCAYIFGGISALIMGTGMSLVMTDIGTTVGIADSMTKGIVVGVVGMFMAIINYPMYRKLLNSRKKRYADQVMELSEKLMNGKN